MDIKNKGKSNITEEQLMKLKKEIQQSLSRDRHNLLMQQPFIGNVAMRFDLIPVRDKRCMTACTDSKSIYFSIGFYASLSDNERQFVLAHEIWHSLNLTFARCQSRDLKLFNIASDMEINNILTNDSVESHGFAPPPNLLYPPKELRGKSAETIYDWLLTQQQQENSLDGILSNASGLESESDDKDTSKLSGQFDKHMYNDKSSDKDNGDSNFNSDSGKSDSDKNKKNVQCDQWGEVGYDEDFQPSISQDAVERMREAAIASAQAYMREHGKLPANIEALINKINKPEISWREYLSQFVSQNYGGKRQWYPPSRRHLYNDIYFQSRYNERIKGVVCIDTSGSCVDDLPKFFGELKGLIDSFGSYELTVMCADAAVDQVDVYDDLDNPFEIDASNGIKWSGGGGTDYGPCFKYIDDNNINPNFLIYIGDGYASMSYKKQPKYPVLWLITKDGSDDFCPWGKKIRFKES